jgi:hypothetical protein
MSAKSVLCVDWTIASSQRRQTQHQQIKHKNKSRQSRMRHIVKNIHKREREGKKKVSFCLKTVSNRQEEKTNMEGGAKEKKRINVLHVVF